ncbi:PVC-type heme-binding CxxCH protein [Gimesia panareensis]|uniref:Cytochrome c n=1 Tax=Gimesia panareensis TaxID=2527978 RepID=A0A517Q3B3_9PLAN|nr:PVC-type heme-binding CxxCH protein [Gimesia panareensis]QDT26089.1 Cytochrome c [Gimesia panareensis]QDU49025.1 Cytochrome c [Gimesia panareensis]
MTQTLRTSWLCLTGCFFLWLPLNLSAQEQKDPFREFIRPTEPLTPQVERESFTVPDGFEVQLVASEPEIQKPLNMAFDVRGRLWVTDSTEYPYPVKQGERGKDTIKILEDTDGDGRADKVTTFAEGLNIPIGLYPYKNGVIAFSIPDISFYEDTDGDNKADRVTKLFGPMGFERDTHGMNNSFRRGFDGWLYANHGFNNQTRVSGSDGHTIEMQSGNTYRMRLDGSRIEQFSHGQVNPFGSTFDEQGNLFTADCHSKPIYQILRGGYYPSFGKPHDGLGFVKPMMDHLHGSTAIAGVAVVSGDQFPAEYQGNFLSGNVMTSRVNRNAPVYHGSTIIAQEQPDFLSTTDPWFRPVDIQLGPDGALYVADFYNKIIGHYEVPLDHPGRDRHRGRIWRIVATGKKHPHVDYTQLSIPELIEQLGSSNLTTRMLITDYLTDQFGDEVIAPLQKAVVDARQPTIVVHALWILFRRGALTDDLLNQGLSSESDLVRIHAAKILAEKSEWQEQQRLQAVKALEDTNAFVQRAAAEGLGLHPDLKNLPPLFALKARVPAEDNHLDYVVRRALMLQIREPALLAKLDWSELNPSQRKMLAELSLAVPTEQAALYLVKYLQEEPATSADLPAYFRHIVRYLPAGKLSELIQLARTKLAGQLDLQVEIIKAVLQGYQQKGLAFDPALKDWGATLAAQLLDSVKAQSLQWVNVPLPGGKADNPWVTQQRASVDGVKAAPFFCSLPAGERTTGRLISSDFKIPAKLEFYIAGHAGFLKQPNNGLNYVQLRRSADQSVVKRASAPRNDLAQKISWDLSEVAGETGYLEIVDGDTGRAYAWLAVGRFEPAVVSVPRTSLTQQVQRLSAAALLAQRFRLQEQREPLISWLSQDRLDSDLRNDLALAVIAIDGTREFQPLFPLPAERVPSTTSFQDTVIQAVVEKNVAQQEPLLKQAFKSYPSRLQTRLAEALCQQAGGSETLISLAEKGIAAPRLLAGPTIRNQIEQSGSPELKQRLQKLISRLPPRGKETQEQIATHLKSHGSFKLSAENGKAVFEKNCAVCHQLNGKGALVGPQLDGVGNRGLERLLEDVLDPNRAVDLNFRTTTVITDAGRVFSGLKRREEGAIVVFVDNKGKEFQIAKEEIEEQKQSPLSLMPANLLEILTPQQLHDLLAYLLQSTKKTTAQH